MPRPTPKVEIAFDAGFTGTPTWTDVTSYVRHINGVSLDAWRGNEDEECGPNRLSLTLANDDGRFTPGNASGAHYPNVKKGRRIRVTATHSAVDYRRFTGYINDWRVAWPGKVSGVADCLVTASSRLARLGRGTELRSLIEETFLLDDPFAYYTMGEPEGSTSAADTSGSGNPSLTVAAGATAPTFGNATGPGTDGLTAAEFAATSVMRVTLDSDPSVWSLEFFLLADAAPGSTTQIARVATLSGLDVANVSLTSGGLLTVSGGLSSTTVVTDGETHHFAITNYGGVGSASLWIDGSVEDSGATTWTGGSPVTLTLGHSEGTEFTVSHVALYESNMINGTPHAASGLTGFVGETPSQRIGRYAGFVGLTFLDWDLETGQVTDLAHIDTTGKTVLAVMREVETTEAGVLFDALDGTLKFHDRAHRYDTASAFTLSYSGGDVANALSPLLDDQQMVNDATATNALGVTANLTDQDSIDEHGPYRVSIDLATDDPDAPLMRAGWEVNRLADPAVRVSEVEVLLNAAGSSLTASLLGAEIGDKFTLSGLPSNAPASSMDLFIEGISETITAEEHRITLRTSPAELFDVWILGDSTYGVLGSTTRLAF